MRDPVQDGGTGLGFSIALEFVPNWSALLVTLFLPIRLNMQSVLRLPWAYEGRLEMLENQLPEHEWVATPATIGVSWPSLRVLRRGR